MNKSLWNVEEALYAAGGIGVVAKILGVLVAPGARGVLGESAVDLVESAAAVFSYVLTVLLVVLVFGASFELARVRSVSVVARGAVVSLSGLILALVGPAIATRLGALSALVLAVVTCIVALVAGVTVLRRPGTRALGGVIGILALTGIVRVISWETAAMGYERGNFDLVGIARGLATVTIALQAIGGLLAATWLGTRSRWRGRVLANVAIGFAFLLTWLAARSEETGYAFATVLRTSLSLAAGVPPPFALGSLAAFLVPAFLLLAAVALVQRGTRRMAVALAFVLLSHGSFDVPLQALLVTAGAQWAMLAVGPSWARQRSGVQQPMSEPAVPPSA